MVPKISFSHGVYLRVEPYLEPFRESERFQSCLFLLYGQLSAFKVKSRCFLSSQGFIGLVHTFSRQVTAGLIYMALCHWWDNSCSSLSHKMAVQKKPRLASPGWLCISACLLPYLHLPSITFHILSRSKQYSQFQIFNMLPREAP